MSWYTYNRLAEIVAGTHMSKGDKNHWRYEMSGVPIAGSFIIAEDMHKSLYDYMKNYGLDWEDVKYPSLVMGAGSYASAGANALRSGMEIAFVSRNLGRLYNMGYRSDRRYHGVEYLRRLRYSLSRIAGVWGGRSPPGIPWFKEFSKLFGVSAAVLRGSVKRRSLCYCCDGFCHSVLVSIFVASLVGVCVSVFGLVEDEFQYERPECLVYVLSGLVAFAFYVY